MEYAREEDKLKKIVSELEKILWVDKLSIENFKLFKIWTSYEALNKLKEIFKDVGEQELRKKLFWATVDSIREKIEANCNNLADLDPNQKEVICQNIKGVFSFYEGLKAKDFKDGYVEDFFISLAGIRGWFSDSIPDGIWDDLKNVLNSLSPQQRKKVLDTIFDWFPTIGDILNKTDILSHRLDYSIGQALKQQENIIKKELSKFVVRLGIVSAADIIEEINEAEEGLLINLQRSLDLPQISSKLASISEHLKKRYGKDILVPFNGSWEAYFGDLVWLGNKKIVEDIKEEVIKACPTNNYVCIKKKYFDRQLKYIHSIDANFADFLQRYYEGWNVENEVLWELRLKEVIDRKFNDINFEKRIKEIFGIDDNQYDLLHKFVRDIYDPNVTEITIPGVNIKVEIKKRNLYTTSISKEKFRENWVWAIKDAKVGVELQLWLDNILENILKLIYPTKVYSLPSNWAIQDVTLRDGYKLEIDWKEYILRGVVELPSDNWAIDYVLILKDPSSTDDKEIQIEWSKIQNLNILEKKISLEWFDSFYWDDIDLFLMAIFLGFKSNISINDIQDLLSRVRGTDLLGEFLLNTQDGHISQWGDGKEEEQSFSEDSQQPSQWDNETESQDMESDTNYLERAERILSEFSGEIHARLEDLENWEGIVLFHYAWRPKWSWNSLFEKAGFFDWIKINIVKIDDDSYRVIITPFTDTVNGASREVVVDSRWLFLWLNNIKDSMGSSIFKMRKLPNFVESGRYLSEWEVKNDYKKIGEKISDWWKKMTKWERGRVTFKSGEFQGEEVKYVGRPTKKWGKDFYQLFEVSFDNNFVHITPAGGQKATTISMSYDSFLLWVGYNGFEGYTQSQYEQFELFQKIETPQGIHKPGRGIMWFSIWAIGGWLKSIWDVWMAQIKEREEFDATKFHYLALENAFSKFMGKALGSAFQDVLADAFTEYDSKIWGIINKYKDLLSRDWGVDSWEALRKVERDLFLKYPKGEIKSLREKLKAAGYLMFVAESWWGGSLYPKALAKYASEGVWVRLILWEKHWEAFKAKYNSQLSQLANNPDNRKLIEDLGDLESVYIFENLKKDKKSKNVFGSKFPKAFIKTFGASRSSSSVDEYSKNISSVSFAGIFEDVRWNIGDLKVAEALWGLKALLSKATIEEEGDISLGAYLAPLVVGLPVSGHFSRDILDDYVKLWRTFGIPAHWFIIDYEGSVRFVRLLDAIAKNIWIPPFSSFASPDWSPENISPQNFSKHFNKILSKYRDRWFEYGKQLKRVLLLSNLDEESSLLKIRYRYQERKQRGELSPLEEEELSAIEAYLQRANQAEIWKSIFENLMDPESPFLENVWAQGPYVMVQRWLAINPHTGAFAPNKERQAHYIWKSVQKWFEGVNDPATEEKETMKFILQKYALWFGERVYTSDGLEDLGAVIYYCLEKNGTFNWECDALLDKVTLGVFLRRYNNKLPWEVKDAIEAFKRLLRDRLKRDKLGNIADFLKDALWIEIRTDDEWISQRLEKLKQGNNRNRANYPSQWEQSLAT